MTDIGCAEGDVREMLMLRQALSQTIDTVGAYTCTSIPLNELLSYIYIYGKR